MNLRQSGNFSGFLFVFIVIIVAAFGVLIWAGAQNPRPIDNIAVPQ